VAVKTFEEFIHSTYICEPPFASELKEAWETATNAAVENFQHTTNKQSTPCPFEYNHSKYKGNHFTYCQHCGVKL
jgi:hypothetical protein